MKTLYLKSRLVKLWIVVSRRYKRVLLLMLCCLFAVVLHSYWGSGALTAARAFSGTLGQPQQEPPTGDSDIYLPLLFSDGGGFAPKPHSTVDLEAPPNTPVPTNTPLPTAAPTDVPAPPTPTDAPTTAPPTPTDVPTTAPTGAPTSALNSAPTSAPTNTPAPPPTNTPAPPPTDTPAPPTAAPTSAPVPAPPAAGTGQVALRQQEALHEMSRIPGDSFRASIHRHTAALLLEQNAGAAANWFKNEGTAQIPDSWHWNSLLYLRSYHLLKDNPTFRSAGAEAAARTLIQGELLNRARRDQGDLGLIHPQNGENLNIVRMSIQLLVEEQAPSINQARYDKIRQYIEEWARERATRGYVEYFSPHYAERLLISLMNIYDFSTDAESRRWAEIAIDQMMAEYAAVEINGFRGGAMRRFYECVRDGGGTVDNELTDGQHDSMFAAGYIFLGLGNSDALDYRVSDQAIGQLGYATTGYRPSPVHAAIVNSRGAFELKSGRQWDHDAQSRGRSSPDVGIYAYVTPHYVLGSIRIPPGQIWGQGPGQPGYYESLDRGVPFRLSFRDARAMLGPEKSTLSTRYCTRSINENAPKDAVALFQYQNVVLYKGEATDYSDLPAPFAPLRGKEGMDHVEREGDFTFYREAGAGGETVYVGIKEQKGVGVLVVELASQAGSWEAFKQSVRGRTIALDSPNNITYDGAGMRIEYRGFHQVRVNGSAYETQNWALYDSPLLSAPWLNQTNRGTPGIITVGNGQTGTLTLDFTQATGPRRIE